MKETTPPCKFGFTKPLLENIIKQTSSLAGFTIGISDIKIIIASSKGFTVCLANGDKYLLKFK